MALHKTLFLMDKKIEAYKAQLRILISANTDEVAQMRKELDTLRQAVHHPKVDDPDRPKSKLKIPPKPEILS